MQGRTNAPTSDPKGQELNAWSKSKAGSPRKLRWVWHGSAPGFERHRVWDTPAAAIHCGCNVPGPHIGCICCLMQIVVQERPTPTTEHSRTARDRRAARRRLGSGTNGAMWSGEGPARPLRSQRAPFFYPPCSEAMLDRAGPHFPYLCLLTEGSQGHLPSVYPVQGLSCNTESPPTTSHSTTP